MNGYSLDKLVALQRNGGPSPLGDTGEEMFLADAIDAYLAIRSPFDGLLEAPEVVGTAYSRHADAIRTAADDLRAVIWPVLEEVFDHLSQHPRTDAAE